MPGHKQFDDIDIPDDFVLPEGSVVRGQKLFKKHCSQCHTIRRDGQNPYGTLAGPNLYGVMGRTAAQNQRSGWGKHSRSLEESGILWTERNMMAFLKNPRAFAGGVINMNFRGMDSFDDRVDLVHYLKRAGHDSWMMMDGTPHTQKRHWGRGGEGPSQSCRQLEDKQLKPWQHLQRMAANKVDGAKQSMFDLVGVKPSAEATKQASDSQSHMQSDPDVVLWQRVRHVTDGVQSASLQQSFNWPPPEDIAAGPVRKPLARVSSSGGTAPVEERIPNKVIVSAAACQEHGCSFMPEGVRAPSGLIVYNDRGGPAYERR
mmetsp:Transcript_116886/g.232958  ORF Transcript_116886/g.232958 Transcript_116886/m.232958 type:complete len:316 (-) Transcript_116886:91-1038(-)